MMSSSNPCKKMKTELGSLVTVPNEHECADAVAEFIDSSSDAGTRRMSIFD